jgi:hypothetical protein
MQGCDYRLVQCGSHILPFIGTARFDWAHLECQGAVQQGSDAKLPAAPYASPLGALAGALIQFITEELWQRSRL